MKALLVIDIQEDYFKENGKMDFNNQFKSSISGQHQKLFKTVSEYINVVNQVIEKEQAEKVEIIYIQEVLPNNLFFRKFLGHSISGTDGVKLHNGLKVSEEKVFVKMFGNAFTNKELKSYIKKQGINEVHIIGLDSTKCAYLTAKGAIKLGLKVKMLSEALFTFYPQNTKKCEDDLMACGAEYIEAL